MSRGRQLKTKKREARELAKAQKIGEIKGEKQAEKHMSMLQKIKYYFSPLLAGVDPLEAAAILSGTIIVHEVIFKTDEFVRSLQAWRESSNKATQVLGGLGILGFEGGLSLEIVSSIFPEQFSKVYGKKPKPSEPSISYNILFWLMAFCASYYAFKHKSDLLGMAKMMMGMI